MRARHRTYCCLSTELPSSLPATRARPALSFFLCERPLLALVCSNQTTFLKRRHCRFGFLSLSLYPPPLFFCFYRVLEGTYLASVRICPFQCEKADDDDSRKVGWWAWTRARTFLHTHTHMHTHTYSSFSFSYAENRIVEALKGQKHVAVSSYVCLADHFYTDRGQVPPSSSLTSSKSNP